MDGEALTLSVLIATLVTHIFRIKLALNWAGFLSVLSTPWPLASEPGYLINLSFKCYFWCSCFSPKLPPCWVMGWLTHQHLPCSSPPFFLRSCVVFLENTYSHPFTSPDRLREPKSVFAAVDSNAKSLFEPAQMSKVRLNFSSILLLASPSPNNYMGLIFSVLFWLLLCFPHLNILST